MENTVSKNGISGYTLKMIAVITMLIDHVGATIVERYLLTNGMLYGAPLVIYYVMRGIGRMAFPIYCYFYCAGLYLHQVPGEIRPEAACVCICV